MWLISCATTACSSSRVSCERALGNGNAGVRRLGARRERVGVGVGNHVERRPGDARRDGHLVRDVHVLSVSSAFASSIGTAPEEPSTVFAPDVRLDTAANEPYSERAQRHDWQPAEKRFGVSGNDAQDRRVEPQADQPHEEREPRHHEESVAAIRRLLLIDVPLLHRAAPLRSHGSLLERQVDGSARRARPASVTSKSSDGVKPNDPGDEVAGEHLLRDVELRRDVVVELPGEADLVLRARRAPPAAA